MKLIIMQTGAQRYQLREEVCEGLTQPLYRTEFMHSSKSLAALKRKVDRLKPEIHWGQLKII